MKIILTGNREPSILSDSLNERHWAFEFIPLERLIAILKNSSQTGLSADVIVSVVHPDSAFETGSNHNNVTPASSVVKLVKELRSLESFHAMKDGRKWASIPFLMIVSSIFSDQGIREPVDATVTDLHGDYSENLDEIQEVVSQYRQRLLDELDNIGLMVTYQRGIYRVGPALTPRDRAVEGEFYYGAADTRDGVRGSYFTVDRDAFGIQYEVETFDALINDPKVTELDLQRFFEENPHFLISTRLMQALPHVPLIDEHGKLLVPDFVIKPIVAVQRDSNWEILDLKHPQAKLLAGPSNHKRFSQDVVKAINQVKDYKDHFENPAHATAITNLLGHPLRHPRLGVLIGRLPAGTEMEALENAQSREPEVRIVTYDEILETQKQLIR